MLRISKLTDYAVVIVTHMAARDPGASYSVSDLASETRIPQPTVGKVVKVLSRSGLLVSQRGVHGGYRLSRAPSDISVADVISSLEGPISMTECASSESTCDREHSCDTRSAWRKINGAIQRALSEIRLSDMTSDASSVARLTQLRVIA